MWKCCSSPHKFGKTTKVNNIVWFTRSTKFPPFFQTWTLTSGKTSSVRITFLRSELSCIHGGQFQNGIWFLWSCSFCKETRYAQFSFTEMFNSFSMRKKKKNGNGSRFWAKIISCRLAFWTSLFVNNTWQDILNKIAQMMTSKHNLAIKSNTKQFRELCFVISTLFIDRKFQF